MVEPPAGDELLEEIGPWSEVKLDIIQEYAAAYSRILSAPGQSRFTHIYVDAFCGAGSVRSRRTGALVPGSPEIALGTEPPFDEYLFIDINEVKVSRLEQVAGQRSDVHIFHGAANEVIMREVLPRIRYRDYRRALVLLDPYGMHYDWETVRLLGQERTVDLFLNFPIMDVNRNVLLRNPAEIAPGQLSRMMRFWGDDSWRDAFYEPSPQMSLFGESSEGKSVKNLAVVKAYEDRLRSLPGFPHVAQSIAMRSPRSNADLYYLMFASFKPVASRIARDIFRKYRSRGAGHGE